jgi:hypothetical protein
MVKDQTKLPSTINPKIDLELRKKDFETF